MVAKLDISRFFIPIGKCLILTLGESPEPVLQHAAQQGYDDLPFADEHGHVLGFFDVSYVRSFVEGRRDISAKDPQLKASFVPCSCTLETLLERVSSNRIVGVLDASGTICGIVTISDLNRHGFRAGVYPLFARLEEQLARLVESHFNDPWDWIGKLGGDKVGLVGHWECLKRDGLDVGPTVGATLTQLLTVLEKTPELSKKVFSSRTQLKEFKGRSVKFRNAVMHPARPLVQKSADVDSLRRFVDQVRVVSEKLSRVA